LVPCKFFPNPFAADLSKRIISFGNKAIEEIAEILLIMVAPSIITQSTFLHANELAKALKSSLLARGVAHKAIGGGGGVGSDFTYRTKSTPPPPHTPTLIFNQRPRSRNIRLYLHEFLDLFHVSDRNLKSMEFFFFGLYFIQNFVLVPFLLLLGLQFRI